MTALIKSLVMTVLNDRSTAVGERVVVEGSVWLGEVSLRRFRSSRDVMLYDSETEFSRLNYNRNVHDRYAKLELDNKPLVITKGIPERTDD